MWECEGVKEWGLCLLGLGERWGWGWGEGRMYGIVENIRMLSTMVTVLAMMHLNHQLLTHLINNYET